MKREVGIEEMIDCAFKLGAEKMLMKIAKCVDADGNIHPRVGRYLAKCAINGVTQEEIEVFINAKQ